MGKDRSCGNDSGIDDNGGRGRSSYKDDGEDSRNGVDHGDSGDYYGGGGDGNHVGGDDRGLRHQTIQTWMFNDDIGSCVR